MIELMQRAIVKFNGTEYESTGEVESGDFGIVTFYQNKNSGKKIVVKSPIDDEDFNLLDWQREEKFWNKAYPANPCQLIKNGDLSELYMPMVGDKTLRDMMGNVQDPEEFLRIYIVVIEALQQLHDKKICHQDIKDRNIRITKTESGYLVYFIDFGKAVEIEKLCDLATDIGGLSAMLYYHNAIKENAILCNLPMLNRIVCEGTDQYPIDRTLDMLRAVCQFELAQLLAQKDVKSALKMMQQVLLTSNLEKLDGELYESAALCKATLLKVALSDSQVSNQSFLYQQHQASSVTTSNSNNSQLSFGP